MSTTLEQTDVRYSPPTNPHGSLNGSAVSAWSRAIALVGIPGVIALLLVWVGSQEVPRLVRQTELNYQATMVNREMLREMMLNQEEQLRLMRWICAGVQKDDADRRNCFQK